MKKITYLVAPLMVLPFLVGCNKGEGGTTHEVTLSETSSALLRFKTENGTEITSKDAAKATEGKDFVFNVETTSNNYKIEEFGVFIYVGEELNPDFKFEGNTEKTSAKVTIPGKYITKEIVLSGLASKEGYYIFDLPYVGLGTWVENVQATSASKKEAEIYYERGSWYGYIPTDAKLTMDFYGDLEGSSVPGRDNVWLLKDGEDIVTIADIEKSTDSWATLEVGSGATYATLTVNADAIKNYLVIGARGSEYNILNSFSWERIQAVSNAGLAPYYFNYGEWKTIKINGHDHVARIIGFDHEVDDEGNTIQGITFQITTVISDANGNAIPYVWNKSSTNADFRSSTLNNTLTKEVLPMLKDDDLSSRIKEVTKKVGIRKSDGTYVATGYPTKLFLLSAQECMEAGAAEAEHVTKDEGYTYEGYDYLVKEMQYPSYSYTRMLADANGKSVAYWSRSPRINNSNRACTISTGGSINGTSVKTSGVYGIAPCFCI